ncbi:type II toxin-antitoxin system HicB family antitoxin [Thiomicrorhabdus aquaedulcis]|uniref:type II toxin-antitoxin system HicB family antitoxin n=1 Tax=Thiomicrorhabdus aquaedulcis TaxID=2211106 RepID=UPI000FD82F7D|nr:type II toxin-antitoxin system HicB family antitoxin [Thiomicrorhabdus aquaedulcis]
MSEFMEYKGYLGSVEYSAQDHCLYGKLAYIRALVNYEAQTVEELEREFCSAVDHYLAVCEKLGKTPQTPLKGTFNIRISPELHRAAVMAAGNKSLNAFVAEAIEFRLAQG